MARRLEALSAFGHEDLSLARLAEPHVDAMAILSDLGRAPSLAGLYAVWASEGGVETRLTVEQHLTGWRLEGSKGFCSGADLCDAALVTAHDQNDRRVIVEVDLGAARRAGQMTTDLGAWVTPAFAATTTATVHFSGYRSEPMFALADASRYLDRPGFWHGALGPAAAWAGGAQGLLDSIRPYARRDQHARAALGSMEATTWAMRAALQQAGFEVDATVADAEAARRRAIVVRHLVERWCTSMIDSAGLAAGPRPLAYDAAVVRRVQELQLYIRQCHGGSELATLCDHDNSGADPS